jgi:choline kinase
MKADGTRYAPWMDIDEDDVEQRKKERLERIKKEKKKGLF